MNHLGAVTRRLRTMGAVSAMAPATVARSAIPRRASMLLRALLFVLVALMLGRLRDQTPATSYIPIGKVLLPLGWLALFAQPSLSRRFGVLRLAHRSVRLVG